MAAKKYVDIRGNEVAGLVTSAGAGDDGKIVCLDGTGKLDTSVLPTGVGPVSVSVTAVGAISAGMFVNLYNSAGTIKMRKADATNNTKPAHGFVLHDVADGAAGNVYTVGNINTAVAGLTVGADYWLDKTTPGGLALDVSAYSGGNIEQYIGYAISATQLIFGNPQFKTTL